MADQIDLSDSEPLTRSIPCSFCSSEIPADSFDDVYWSATKRLLSASCPGCHQRSVLSFKLWRRWTGLSVLSEG
jgi:hypothetical protein